MDVSSIIFDRFLTPCENQIHQTLMVYRWILVTFLKNGGMKLSQIMNIMIIYSIFLWLHCQIYSVTDEALIAETMVWPNFFLMNVFFALKGSKLFTIISYHCSWMLCRVAAVKSLSALIYSADYILFLVL